MYVFTLWDDGKPGVTEGVQENFSHKVTLGQKPTGEGKLRVYFGKEKSQLECQPLQARWGVNCKRVPANSTESIDEAVKVDFLHPGLWDSDSPYSQLKCVEVRKPTCTPLLLWLMWTIKSNNVVFVSNSHIFFPSKFSINLLRDDRSRNVW